MVEYREVSGAEYARGMSITDGSTNARLTVSAHIEQLEQGLAEATRAIAVLESRVRVSTAAMAEFTVTLHEPGSGLRAVCLSIGRVAVWTWGELRFLARALHRWHEDSIWPWSAPALVVLLGAVAILGKKIYVAFQGVVW